MIRCILFDRDGTLGSLKDVRYPQTFLPFCDIKSVFSELRKKGYFVGIITNQSSIARGTGKGYDFQSEFTAYGCNLWEICPHDAQDNCRCRKPESGMLLSAANRLGISPEECLVVGDRLSDMQCAKNAGAESVFVLTGNGKDEKDEVCRLYPEITVINRFDDILKII